MHDFYWTDMIFSEIGNSSTVIYGDIVEVQCILNMSRSYQVRIIGTPQFVRLEFKNPQEDGLKWELFPLYWLFVRETTDDRGIPLRERQWCGILTEQAVEHTVFLSMI